MGPIGDDGDDGDTTREHRHAFVDGDETGSKRLDDDADVRETFARREASSRVFSRESEEKKTPPSPKKKTRDGVPGGTHPKTPTVSLSLFPKRAHSAR